MKSKYKLFRPLVLSKNYSCEALRAKNKNLPLLPYRSVIRFGSTTVLEDDKDRVQINSVESVKISSNKRLMKQKFEEAEVKTATWEKGERLLIDKTNNEQGIAFEDNDSFYFIEFPVVAKGHYGSKGKSNTLIKSKEELIEWLIGKNLNHYIFEKFMNYGHEFRLHISEKGCFYACRKALKQDIPVEQKWHFHDDTCVWYLEENEKFFKPNSWDNIIDDCINALKAIGADVLAFDVKVQTPFKKNGTPREYQEYILLESNTAPSMDNGTGELSVCAKKYIEELPKIIVNKYNKK